MKWVAYLVFARVVRFVVPAAELVEILALLVLLLGGKGSGTLCGFHLAALRILSLCGL